MSLDATITRLALRQAVGAVGRQVARCLLIGVAVAILLAAADKLVYLGIDVRSLIGAALCLAAVTGIVLAARGKRATRLNAAVEADRVLGLADRIASAVQLGREDGPWAEAVTRDADERSRAIRAADVFPFHPTLAARLLVPAIIVLALVWLLPPLDLLGRMARAVEAELQGRMAAERTASVAERAVAAAALGPSGGAASPESRTGGLGALRVTLFNIEQDLAGGKMENARRIDLSERLRRLAELMEQGGAAPKLAEAIRRASKKLASNDADAVASLRAAQEELDRLEKALRESKFTDAYARRIAERKRAELRAAALAGGSEGSPGAADDGGDEDLVELAASAKRAPDAAGGSGGILYSPSDTGASRPADWRGYDASVKVATEQIESGAVPPRHARLVRGYFDSIKPVGE